MARMGYLRLKDCHCGQERYFPVDTAHRTAGTLLIASCLPPSSSECAQSRKTRRTKNHREHLLCSFVPPLAIATGWTVWNPFMKRLVERSRNHRHAMCLLTRFSQSPKKIIFFHWELTALVPGSKLMSSGVKMSVTSPRPLCKWNLVRCASSEISQETWVSRAQKISMDFSRLG